SPSCFSDPPALHPFPTRRSSDLVRGLSVFPTVQVQTGHQRAGSPLRSASTCHFSRSELACCQQVGQGFLQIGEDLLMHFVYGSADRKSTRLNSSHVKISYAVFCL